MHSETRNCQNCKTDFLIEPEDFLFYEKMQVPAPTFCPECRLIRRLIVQNERALYRRKCDLCGEIKLMVITPESERVAYCSHCWWSDAWDPMDYAKEYDFSRPFFEQYKELLDSVPAMGINNILSTMVNSDYCSICSYLKNCYLCFNSDYSEDCMYSTYLEESNRCVDMSMAKSCEICYMTTNAFKCFKVFFSDRCNECLNVWFSRDLDGCSDCFGCINLRNKQYYIFNESYTKEGYFEKLKEFNLGSYASIVKYSQQSKEFHTKHPRRYMEGLKNMNVSGDYIFNSKNTHLSYEIFNAEDSKYCQLLILGGTKDAYDFTMWGMNPQRVYECLGAGNNSSDIKFISESWSSSSRMQYCRNIFLGCRDLFGCISLKGAQYCILNKQYSKQEYEELLPKIIQHMNEMPFVDSKGHMYKYGEFFPPEFSLHAYNETAAQKYFPLTKEQAFSNGYRWYDQLEKNYAITIKSNELPDTILEVSDDITSEIIECAHVGQCVEQCSTAFKITKDELVFYKTNNLPLPRLCSNCRFYSLVKKHYPIRYYRRACECQSLKQREVYQNIELHEHGENICMNSFTTTFPPDAVELVYCESCYQKEVL